MTPNRRVNDFLVVPEKRHDGMRRIVQALEPAKNVGLSTHMNADGDGCGSEMALGHMLARKGKNVRIVNPTPWPTLFDFLRDPSIEERSQDGANALKGLDALVVMDISDVTRLGHLTDAVRKMTIPKLVIDHHIPSDQPAGDIVLADPAACATAELVFDLASGLDVEIDMKIAQALYSAILTDTGAFRFSNTSPRAHAISAVLLARGVDPESMYTRIYASAPPGRIRLLADVLQTLGVDEETGLAWLSLPAGLLEHYGVRQEDLDGIVEHARSIAGTRMALFFRDLGYGKVKVSFRSTGDVDVNRFARKFGGGGHAKASGALIAGSLEEVKERVIGAAKEYLSALNGSSK